MKDSRAEKLLTELLADPRKFDEEGRAYDLLQSYFAGFPLATLRPLLRSEDEFVQRSAAFIVSELGSSAESLIDDIIVLLGSTDRHVRYYAMEALTVCSMGEQAEKFAHVARMLESEDAALRALAMRLLSKADRSQLEAAGNFFKASGAGDRRHESGLLTLAVGSKIEPSTVGEMIRDTAPLTRKYGAIAAKLLLREHPELMAEAAKSEDSELQKFAQEQPSVTME